MLKRTDATLIASEALLVGVVPWQSVRALVVQNKAVKGRRNHGCACRQACIKKIRHLSLANYVPQTLYSTDTNVDSDTQDGVVDWLCSAPAVQSAHPKKRATRA